MVADGFPSSRLLGEVRRAKALRDTPVSGDTLSQDEVRELQALLNQLGHPAGPEDGLVGQRTLRAIGTFLADRQAGLEAAPSAAVLAEARVAASEG